MNNQNENTSVPSIKEAEVNDRREALKKLGKYSAYVAPFTVLAFAQKASATATGGGSQPKHP